MTPLNTARTVAHRCTHDLVLPSERDGTSASVVPGKQGGTSASASLRVELSSE